MTPRSLLCYSFPNCLPSTSATQLLLEHQAVHTHPTASAEPPCSSAAPVPQGKEPLRQPSGQKHLACATVGAVLC